MEQISFRRSIETIKRIQTGVETEYKKGDDRDYNILTKDLLPEEYNNVVEVIIEMMNGISQIQFHLTINSNRMNTARIVFLICKRCRVELTPIRKIGHIIYRVKSPLTQDKKKMN